MRLTDEMVLQDNKRFEKCNALAELKYCGWEVPHRKSITNDEIRFYAWLCRSAVELLKEQDELLHKKQCDINKLCTEISEWKHKFHDTLKEQETANLYKCPNCGTWVSAENVVRCKDCAYAIFKEGLVQHGNIICTKPFTERWQVVKPSDWFCADRKRK